MDKKVAHLRADIYVDDYSKPEEFRRGKVYKKDSKSLETKAKNDFVDFLTFSNHDDIKIRKVEVDDEGKYVDLYLELSSVYSIENMKDLASIHNYDYADLDNEFSFEDYAIRQMQYKFVGFQEERSTKRTQGIYTVDQLRRFLREGRLDDRGTRSELVDRLKGNL